MAKLTLAEIAPSPLDYNIGKQALRLQLLVEGVPPPSPREDYFAETTRTIRYGKNGALLKKPKIEVTPGADRDAVSFVDFSRVNYGRDQGVFIHYMKTRSDQRNKGYSMRLLRELTGIFGKDAFYDFGRVMSDEAWHLKEKLDAQGFRTYGKNF